MLVTRFVSRTGRNSSKWCMLIANGFGILRPAGMRQPLVVRRFTQLCDRLKDQCAFEAMIARNQNTDEHSRKK